MGFYRCIASLSSAVSTKGAPVCVELVFGLGR